MKTTTYYKTVKLSLMLLLGAVWMSSLSAEANTCGTSRASDTNPAYCGSGGDGTACSVLVTTLGYNNFCVFTHSDVLCGFNNINDTNENVVLTTSTCCGGYAPVGRTLLIPFGRFRHKPTTPAAHTHNS
jgi:hypothetical protein